MFEVRKKRVKTHLPLALLPDLVVGEGPGYLFYRVDQELECRRIDNADRVWYVANELRPLTPAAREMLALVRK